jgi:hypothetical protein
VIYDLVVLLAGAFALTVALPLGLRAFLGSR